MRIIGRRSARTGRLASRPSPRTALAAALDQAAAVARPAITVTLAVSGWIFAGGVVGQAAIHVAGNWPATLPARWSWRAAAKPRGRRRRGPAAGRRPAIPPLAAPLRKKRAEWLAGFLEAHCSATCLSNCGKALPCRIRRFQESPNRNCGTGGFDRKIKCRKMRPFSTASHFSVELPVTPLCDTISFVLRFRSPVGRQGQNAVVDLAVLPVEILRGSLAILLLE